MQGHRDRILMPLHSSLASLPSSRLLPRLQTNDAPAPSQRPCLQHHPRFPRKENPFHRNSVLLTHIISNCFRNCFPVRVEPLIRRASSCRRKRLMGVVP